MRSILIEDGNLRFWFRLVLVIAGCGMAAVAIMLDIPVALGQVLLLMGFAVALVGGMASRAKMLKIKPFDDSYQKARDSYRSNSSDKNES